MFVSVRASSDANQRAHTQINFNFASAQKMQQRQSAVAARGWLGLLGQNSLAKQMRRIRYFSGRRARADVTDQITLPISI